MSEREKRDEEARETDRRTKSTTSIEETEGQDTDLRARGSDGRTDRRRGRDPRSMAEKKREKEPQGHGLGESSENPARTGVKDCYHYLKNGHCRYGLSCRYNHPPTRHGMVQPTSPYPVRPQLPESSQTRDETVQPSPYPGAGYCRQYLQRGQCSYGPKCRFNHPPRDQMTHEMVQPGPYPVRLGASATDCIQFLRNGKCSYGPKCRYNHPPSPVLPQWVSRQNCKFFQKGYCEYGSGCKFTHSMSGDGSEPMRQATTWGKKHGASSRSRPWKRERQGHYLEEQKQKNRKVENLRIGPSVQSGEGGTQTEQRLEVPENVNVNAQVNLQEQADMERQEREAQEKAQEERRLHIENERRQARLRLERMKHRPLTSNVDQLRETLPDIGIERKEGDGF